MEFMETFHLLIFSVENEQCGRHINRATLSESGNIFDSFSLFPTSNTLHTNAKTSKQKKEKL